MQSLKTICVYCGSSAGRSPAYADGARSLAESLVKRGIGLVYGGAGIGLMGEIANHVLRLGGRAVGVIPEALMRKEVAHYQLTELHVTRTMHERKMKMAELADGFIALPGGLGTLEELFEIWTWAQLGFHRKPCGLLNIESYYDPLIEFLDHAVSERFVREAHRSLLVVAENSEALLDRFADYRPPSVNFSMNQEDI